MIPARKALKAGLFLLALLAPAGLLPVIADAQTATQANQPPKPELSDKVAGQIQDIVLLMQGNPQAQPPTQPNIPAALAAVNALLPQAAPDSYDTFYLSQIKAQATLNTGDYVSATRALETMLDLLQRHANFDRPDKGARIAVLDTLSRIYLNNAAGEKNPETQKQLFTKALTMLRQWIALVPRPSSDAYTNIASILFQQAIAPKVPDQALLKEAETEANNAMITAIAPKEGVYALMVAIAQAQNDPAKSARYLEVLVANNPKNATYWSMLWNAYLATIESLPEDSFLRNEAYAKAIYTIKRAQQNGFMQTPADFFNVAAIYYQAGQYEGAVDLLEAGLHNGKMDATKYTNWELLANIYRQGLDNVPKSIATFREAMQHFPTDGNIDMQVGQLYFDMQQYRPALEALLAAAKKEVTPKRLPSLYAYIAYVHLYLKEFEQGMEAVKKALELDPNSQEAKGIKSALEDAIQQRDRALGNVPDQPPAPAPQQGQQQQQQQPAQPAQPEAAAAPQPAS